MKLCAKASTCLRIHVNNESDHEEGRHQIWVCLLRRRPPIRSGGKNIWPKESKRHIHWLGIRWKKISTLKTHPSLSDQDVDGLHGHLYSTLILVIEPYQHENHELQVDSLNISSLEFGALFFDLQAKSRELEFVGSPRGFDTRKGLQWFQSRWHNPQRIQKVVYMDPV